MVNLARLDVVLVVCYGPGPVWHTAAQQIMTASQTTVTLYPDGG
jgi:hypothetical protein